MSGVLRTVGRVAGIVATVAMLTGNPVVAGIATAVSPLASAGAPIAETPMTAINLCADSRRAYLATDGGYFDPATGRIVALGGKVVVVPGAHLAIGFSGSASPGELRDRLEAVGPEPTQRAILTALPAAVAAMIDDRRGRMQAEWCAVRLWIASYDRVRAKPRLYTMTSDPDPTMPAATPFQVREIGGWSTGVTPAQLSTILPAGYVADPRADMARLFQAQRGYAFAHMGGRCGVAGDCRLYTVSRKGVTWETVVTFPEGVGEMPDGGNLPINRMGEAAA